MIAFGWIEWSWGGGILNCGRAMNNLVRFLIVAALILLVAQQGYCQHGQLERRGGQAEPSMDELLADYRAYGLPLPPADAKLVQFECGSGSINGKPLPKTHFLAFLLRPGGKDKQPVLLVGTQERHASQYEAKTLEIVEPRAELGKSLELNRFAEATFDMNDGLAVALQCQARGWKSFAQELWAASLKQDIGHGRGAFHQPENLSSRSALEYLVWTHYGNELVKPDTDRAKIAKQMKAVLGAEPKLNTEYRKNLIKSLEAALAPSTAKPGTIERMIDDLTDMCNTGLTGNELDPRYSRLADMGFAAVPALLEHLEDNRLTRSVHVGFNNFPLRNTWVGEVVSGLLQAMAGEDLGKNWLRRLQGWNVEKADALAWWDIARKEGEESYFVRNVISTDEKKTWPNSVMLNVITKKYPQHLPKLYKKVLDERPMMQSWELAAAVARSSLPDEKKRALFVDAANRKNVTHCRVGLTYLQKLDPQQFSTILLARLESLPGTPANPYSSCEQGYFAYLVATTTDDPKVWKMLEKVAKRSDVGLRMEFLSRMVYEGDGGDVRRQRRLDFLVAFLDDAEVPDLGANSKMFDGFEFRRLEVRDLAAMRIAYILGMPDVTDWERTPEQWKKLRNQVGEKLRK